MTFLLMIRNILLSLALISWISCQQQSQTPEVADQRSGDPIALNIIDQAIQAHGGDRYRNHDIEFDFRGRHYKSQRRDGIFSYERIFTDTTDEQIRDVLSNTGLSRYINGKETNLTDERKEAFSNSVNSVVYFALLPYFLQDAAVKSNYLGETSIHNEPYHKIKITFRQEEGGTDFEDEFIYWFHRDRHTLDYLAYNYQTEGGGARFRQAFNSRQVGGIRFSDYINYKPETETLYIMNFDSLFQAGALDSLSVIATENIVVK